MTTSSLASLSLDQLSIDTLRILAVDTVEKAKSGHPGAPLGCSPISYLLFHKIMKHNPALTTFPGRASGNRSLVSGSAFVLSKLRDSSPSSCNQTGES
jgi:transketolase